VAAAPTGPDHGIVKIILEHPETRKNLSTPAGRGSAVETKLSYRKWTI
jgi:hypothetical protein